jgi:hypothetical protein
MLYNLENEFIVKKIFIPSLTRLNNILYEENNIYHTLTPLKLLDTHTQRILDELRDEADKLEAILNKNLHIFSSSISRLFLDEEFDEVFHRLHTGEKGNLHEELQRKILTIEPITPIVSQKAFKSMIYRKFADHHIRDAIRNPSIWIIRLKSDLNSDNG